MRSITVLALVVLSISASGQTFNWKSNDIQVNGKSPNVEVMPEITWITPRIEYSNTIDTQVEVEATIRSEVALKSILIAVGDQMTKEVKGSKPVAVSAGINSQTIKQRIKLNEGANFIEIEAENISGAKAFSQRFVVVGKDAIIDAVALNRTDYALLIATDKYDNWDDLVNPINDANTIAKELTDRYGFKVDLLENPTQDEILLKIREYSERRYKPQDQLFIFFAGHGQFDDSFGEGYLVAKNSFANDRAKSSYISHSNLRSYIGNIPCEHILLTMDVCFGGTFDPVIARSRAADYKDVSNSEYLVRKLTGKTRKYITSGGKEYVSDGVAGRHSPFAAKFLEAMRTNGGDDRILTMNEILSVLEKIKSNEPRTGDFADGEKGADFVFVASQQ